MTERDILYKLVFDLKKDLNDLKQFVFDMTRTQHTNGAGLSPITLPDAESYRSKALETLQYPPVPAYIQPIAAVQAKHEEPSHIIIDGPQSFTTHEMIDESLSLADKEKELIVKALKKHRNRRRDAATDLGISERTLYRKIKEYDLEK
jgi:DNA-binding NtrC family response regulator